MSLDVKALGDALVSAVKEHVANAVSGLSARLDDLDRRLRQTPAGAQGERGPAGEKGEVGPVGPAGEVGPAGPQGEKGDPGPTGPQGAPGEKGADGEPGAPGDRGERGDPGERGERGEKGEAGDRGEQGPAGPQGDRGEKGDPGEVGVPGPKGDPGDKGDIGPQGPEGRKGDIGPAGPQGWPGKDGAAGRSAYELALDEGFSGTKQQWLESLRGVAGKDGRDGREGKDGRDGIAGKDGKDGEPGRDALSIEILPMIEDGKIYARGTFAQHRGGLWRASSNATGTEGWECVVAGLHDLSIGQDELDPRAIKLRAIDSRGEVQERRFVLPVMIYRGVFRDGEQYTKGDTVTYGGSLWHCNEPTGIKPDIGDKAWTLAAKRGRDGKDGAQGERGPEGKAAR